MLIAVKKYHNEHVTYYCLCVAGISMSKEQEAGAAGITASAPPLPTAPPPSYDQAMSHAFNPHIATQPQPTNPPYHYRK